MGTPLVVDLRANLPDARDQGARDTCVAFSITCAHEAARRRQEALSEDALYWGCKTLDGNWDGGTSFDTAANALSEHGQPEATMWPYDLAHREGEALLLPRGVSPGGSWRRARLEAIEPTEVAVCAALARASVVVLGVELTLQWYVVDGTGILAPLAGGDDMFGLHAVVAAGFDRTAGLLWIRNSWGANWARAGYAALSSLYYRHIIEARVVPPDGLDPAR